MLGVSRDAGVAGRRGSLSFRSAAYWLATLALVAEMGVGGTWDIVRLPAVRDLVAHLGYPPYFLVLLGTWKVLGAAALLVPRRALLKEWAYAGAFFTYSGAMISHLATGYALGEVGVLAPLVALTVLSWALRPASRRVPGRTPAAGKESAVALAAAGAAAPARARMDRALSLAVRNVLFTLVVPGLGAVWAPWSITTGHGRAAAPVAWAAVPVIAVGAALYVWCVWNFAAIGDGTPGPWDAPARVVATGPYRWVRNPIYIGALGVVTGEAWLFMSWRLLIYAGARAVCFHLFVLGYEERTLTRRFGGAYLEYKRAVPRWIPRPPRPPRRSRAPRPPRRRQHE